MHQKMENRMKGSHMEHGVVKRLTFAVSDVGVYVPCQERAGSETVVVTHRNKSGM